MIRNLLITRLKGNNIDKNPALINLVNVIDIYHTHTQYSVNHNFDTESFRCNMILTSPQRQQCFSFYDLKSDQQLSFTAGKFLSQTYAPAKFYKRSVKNIGSIVMTLKQQHLFMLQKIFLLKIKNLTYKQWLFWERFEDTIHPDIKFFFHKKSYLPRWQGKRRIKRVVLRMLMKQ